MRPPLARLRTGNTLYELEDERTTIGRDASNDLVIDSKGVSRLQAVLTLGAAAQRLLSEPFYEFSGSNGLCRAVLQDDGSTNGTFVNGKRVSQEPFALHHGDLIFFSAYEKTSYRFEIPGMDVPTLPNVSLPPAKVPLIGGGCADQRSRFDRSPTRDQTPIASRNPVSFQRQDQCSNRRAASQPPRFRPYIHAGEGRASTTKPLRRATSTDAFHRVRDSDLQPSKPYVQNISSEHRSASPRYDAKPWDEHRYLRSPDLGERDMNLLEESFKTLRDCVAELTHLADAPESETR